MAFFVRNLQIRCPASATTKASPPLHRSDSLPSAPRSKLSGTADEGVRRRPGTHYFNLPRPFSLAKAKPEPHHRLHHQNLSRSATERRKKKNQKTKIEKCTCRAFAAQPTSPSSEPAPFPFPLPRQPSLLFRVNPAAPPLATAPWRPAELPGAPRRLPRGPPARARPGSVPFSSRGGLRKGSGSSSSSAACSHLSENVSGGGGTGHRTRTAPGNLLRTNSAPALAAEVESFIIVRPAPPGDWPQGRARARLRRRRAEAAT